MTRSLHARRARICALALASTCSSLFFVACSSGNNGSNSPIPTDLRVQSVNVAAGETWSLNRPIEIVFSRDVDLASVDATTLSLIDDQGVPAVGSYRFVSLDTNNDGTPDDVDARRLLFVPQGPLLADGSDVGLVADRQYLLTLPEGGMSAVGGGPLVEAFSRTFQTPNGPVLLSDEVVGPPEIVLRARGTSYVGSTHVRLGDDSAERVYFEYDASTLDPEIEPQDARLGLDLYSEAGTKPVYYLVLNQQISPALDNLNSNLVRLEAVVPGLPSKPWATRTTLLENDVITGAVLRLEPMGGPLPRGGSLQVVLAEGLADIVGQTRIIGSGPLAVAPVDVPTTPGLVPSTVVADAINDDITSSVTFTSATTAEATSDWFPIGAANRNENGALVPVRFRFEGIDPLDGRVPTSGGQVLTSGPVLGPFQIGAVAPEVRFDGDDTLVLEAGTLAPWIFTIGPSDQDAYLRNPKLLVGSDVELDNGAGTERFPILGAEYDAVMQTLRLQLSDSNFVPSDYLDAGTGVRTGAIIERFFRVSSNGVFDRLPPDASVAFRFQAIGATPDCQPDPSQVLVDWTGDVSSFDLLPYGGLSFFRWRVELDLDVSGDGVMAGEPVPVLEAFQLAFRF